MTSSPVRSHRRTYAHWRARAADLARRLSESRRRYADLASETRRQAEALARLDEVRSAIGRENTVDMILRVAVEAITGSFGYASVSIYLLEDGALVLRHGVGHTSPAERVLSNSLPLGHVAHTGEPLMITDTRIWHERLDLGPGVASAISAPLWVGGQVAGVAHIESSQPNALGTDDLSWLLTLSDHVGKAVERTRLRGDLQRTMRETLALNRMMSVIATARDTREALQIICADDEVIGMIGLSSAESHIFTPDDIGLAQRLSTTIGQALTNLRLHAALHQELTEFLATMRHEIRAPIHSVIGIAGQLLDSALSDEQRKHAEAIRAHGEAALTIINTILDLAKIDQSGKR